MAQSFGWISCHYEPTLCSNCNLLKYLSRCDDCTTAWQILNFWPQSDYTCNMRYGKGLLFKVSCAYYLHYEPLPENHFASLWYMHITGCNGTKFWMNQFLPLRAHTAVTAVCWSTRWDVLAVQLHDRGYSTFDPKVITHVIWDMEKVSQSSRKYSLHQHIFSTVSLMTLSLTTLSLTTEPQQSAWQLLNFWPQSDYKRYIWDMKKVSQSSKKYLLHQHIFSTLSLTTFSVTRDGKKLAPEAGVGVKQDFGS